MGLFGRKIKVNPEDSIAWNNKGTAWHELEKHEEAILCFDELIRLEPEHSSGWHNKSDSLKKLGKDEEAEECFVKSKELAES